MNKKNQHGPSAPNAAAPGTITIEEAVARAYGHWNAGQNAQAEQLCTQVLQAWPQHASALHLMGLLAFTHGNRPLAIDYLRRACAAPSAPAIYHSNLAEIYRQSGRMGEAEEAARRALAIDNQLVAGWTNLGIVLQESGKLEESHLCLQRAVERAPSAENHNNLANTLKRMGRLEEAGRHYRAALALKPSYAEAHNNLALLLNTLGDSKAAMEEVRKAIDLNPQYADAYVNAAAICLTSNDTAEALRWLNNLASFAPDHPGGLIARARAFLEGDRCEDALEAARRATDVAPESGEAADVLGQVLAMQDKSAEALAAFERASKLPAPQPESALVGKGALLMELGRNPEALQAFDAALAVNPNSARALFNRTSIRKCAAGDPDIALMKSLLASGTVEASDDKIMLHFALGKVWLDAGDSERAFAHLAQGSRLKRASFEYDPDATERWVAEIAETFSPDLMARFAGAGDTSDVPVFVLGMPRSGTTLIEQILASHPRLHGAGELKTLNHLVESSPNPVPGSQLFPAMMKTTTPQALAALGKSYADQVRSLAPGKAHVVDKMPGNFLYAGLIHLILPKVRIIHSRRDGVDTCLSCYTKLFAGEQKFTYDLAELGRFHRSYDTLMAHWRKLLPADRFLEVQYEDVVDDLEGQSRRMIEFLGLEWDEACLKFHQTARQIHTASFNQVREPIYRSSVGRWKRYAKHLRPLLDSLGVEAE